MVQGLGQRRGACSEFSPGIPFMWRKVEMRLACTATRLPPTPAETKDLRRGGRDESPEERDIEKKDKDNSPAQFQGVFQAPPTCAPGVAERVDTGRSADSGSSTSPAAQGVHLLLHTGQGTALLASVPLQSSEQTQAPSAHVLVSDQWQVPGLSSALWNLVSRNYACYRRHPTPNLLPALFGLALSPARLTSADCPPTSHAGVSNCVCSTGGTSR